MTDDIKNQIENAARYIIETSARETSTGNWITYPDEIPASVISAELFSIFKRQIIGTMQEYEAVAEAYMNPDGSIDVMMYLGYCPNFEPDADERDDYPDDREILDPLTTWRRAEAHEPAPIDTSAKPTLAERLEEGKRRAAQHEKPDNTNKTTKQGERE